MCCVYMYIMYSVENVVFLPGLAKARLHVEQQHVVQLILPLSVATVVYRHGVRRRVVLAEDAEKSKKDGTCARW